MKKAANNNLYSTSVFFSLLVIAFWPVDIRAQSAAFSVPLAPAASPTPSLQPTPSPAEKSFEDYITDIKKPASWLSWGSDLRVRDEYSNNNSTLSDQDPLHEQNVIRTRSRIWTSVTPDPDLAFNTRLTAEPRNWTRPSNSGAFQAKEGMEWRYGIFDSMNIVYKNVAEQPLTVIVGRQDIFLGDAGSYWLTGDGTPRDGSFTLFLDAVRASLDLQEAKTKIDLIALHQNAQVDDSWLPTIDANQKEYSLAEQNEIGAILYVSNKSLPDNRIDGYFMYKGDEQELKNGDNADIFTFGSRVVGTPFEHWYYTAEGAYQFGWKKDPMVTYPVDESTNGRELSAYGGITQLSYLIKDSYNNQLHLVCEFLSGDKPSTPGRDEMFDIMWGRWPRWSELYASSYSTETGKRTAQWNNLVRIGSGWTVNPVEKTTFGFYYNALFAQEETPTRNVDPTLFSMNSNFRGHYLQTVLIHHFSKHLRGHLWLELLFQGDYYSNRDTMSFVRPELMFTF